jgi:hypothetical protein
MKVRARWFLKTVDGPQVYQNLRGIATLEAGSNMMVEFIEGQHPLENKEALAIAASSSLVVVCVWERLPDWVK